MWTTRNAHKILTGKNLIKRNHLRDEDRHKADIKIGLKETVSGDVKWTEEVRLQHDVNFSDDGHEFLSPTITRNFLNCFYNLHCYVHHKIS